MEATVELGESPNGDLSTGIGIEGGGVESGEGAEDPEGAASSSLFPAPAVVAPPLRFDESIVVAAQSYTPGHLIYCSKNPNWDQVKSLHEKGISLDSVDGVRGSHHYTIMTCN